MDFYYFFGSAPCHSVMMTAKTVGVKLNLKSVDLLAKEQLKPEFIKINPQHTIPTLVDNGFALWESRAISIYLAEKYDKTNSLYPNCPKKRAIINQRLFFDLGTLYQRFSEYYYPQLFAKAPPNPESFKKMEEAVGFLDTFLTGQTYAAGDTITLADNALLATIACYDASGFDLSKYPNVNRWFNHCKKTVPEYNIIQEGVDEFKKKFLQKLME